MSMMDDADLEYWDTFDEEWQRLNDEDGQEAREQVETIEKFLGIKRDWQEDRGK